MGKTSAEMRAWESAWDNMFGNSQPTEKELLDREIEQAFQALTSDAKYGPQLVNTRPYEQRVSHASTAMLDGERLPQSNKLSAPLDKATKDSMNEAFRREILKIEGKGTVEIPKPTVELLRHEYVPIGDANLPRRAPVGMNTVTIPGPPEPLPPLGNVDPFDSIKATPRVTRNSQLPVVPEETKTGSLGLDYVNDRTPRTTVIRTTPEVVPELSLAERYPGVIKALGFAGKALGKGLGIAGAIQTAGDLANEYYQEKGIRNSGNFDSYPGGVDQYLRDKNKAAVQALTGAQWPVEDTVY